MLTGGNCRESGSVSYWSVDTYGVFCDEKPRGGTLYAQLGTYDPGKLHIPPDKVRTVQAAQVGPPVVFTCINVVTCRIGRQGTGDVCLTARA